MANSVSRQRTFLFKGSAGGGALAGFLAGIPNAHHLLNKSEIVVARDGRGQETIHSPADDFGASPKVIGIQPLVQYPGGAVKPPKARSTSPAKAIGVRSSR
jgi:hypothetical protein